MQVRNSSIDIIKVLAMIGVVCLHTTYPYIIPHTFTIADILYKTAVISIPLFFMASGYLLFGRRNIDYAYIIKKQTNIIQFVFIIVFAYWLLWLAKHQTLDLKIFAEIFVYSFIQRGPFAVFWYLGAMVIIYTLLPILNYIYEHNVDIFRWLLVSLCIICNIMFICNLCGGGEVLIIQPFRIYNWLFYFCVGGYVKHISTLKIRPIYIILLILLNVVFQEELCPYIGTEFCEYFYPSFVVMLLSVSIFKYIVDNPIQDSLLLNKIAPLFLPVYTIHMFIIILTQRFFTQINLGLMEPLIYWVFISVMTVVISYCIMKTPIIHKIFRL